MVGLLLEYIILSAYGAVSVVPHDIHKQASRVLLQMPSRALPLFRLIASGTTFLENPVDTVDTITHTLCILT